MKAATPKSNLLDYDKLYNILFTFLTLALLYIAINFLLPTANLLTFFFLTAGVFAMIIFLISRQKAYLSLSLILTLLTIAISLLFIYLK